MLGCVGGAGAKNAERRFLGQTGRRRERVFDAGRVFQMDGL
jgi:hypothetical protein